MRMASSGVSGEGLSTIVQPESSAGASFDIVTNCGTFHGTMAPTTPTGSRRTMTGGAEHAGALLLPLVARWPTCDEGVEHHPRRRRLGQLREA